MFLLKTLKETKATFDNTRKSLANTVSIWGVPQGSLEGHRYFSGNHRPNRSLTAAGVSGIVVSGSKRQNEIFHARNHESSKTFTFVKKNKQKTFWPSHGTSLTLWWWLCVCFVSMYVFCLIWSFGSTQGNISFQTEGNCSDGYSRVFPFTLHKYCLKLQQQYK